MELQLDVLAQEVFNLLIGKWRFFFIFCTEESTAAIILILRRILVFFLLLRLFIWNFDDTIFLLVFSEADHLTRSYLLILLKTFLNGIVKIPVEAFGGLVINGDNKWV